MKTFYRTLAGILGPLALTGCISLFEADWPKPYSYQYLSVAALFAFWGFAPAVAAAATSATVLYFVWTAQPIHGIAAFMFAGVLLGVFGELARRRGIALDREIQRLNAVLDVLPVGVIIANADGSVTHENRRAREIWDQADSTQRAQQRGYSPEGRALARADWPLARALRHGRAYLNEEIQIETVEGQRKAILASAAPLVERGEIAGAVSAIADITERVEFRRELVSREQMFRTFFERLHEYAVILRPVRSGDAISDWQVVDANDQAVRTLFHCTSRDACIGHLLSELVSREYVDSRMDRFLRALHGDEPVQYEGNLGGVISLVTVFRFTHDAIAMTALDVTGIKNAEEQSRRRAEELETLMDLVPVAIWVSDDPECRHIIGNRTANEFYEAGADENVSASTLPDVRRFFSDSRELSADELPMQFAARHNTEVRNAELEVLLPSGRRFAMLGSASPLRDTEGRVRGALSAFLDITERKKAERRLLELNRDLAAANRQKDEFLAMVSHELRTPLNVVLGYTRMLTSRPTFFEPGNEEGVKRVLTVIERNAIMQLRLIEDLLDVHRITTGRLSLERGEYNLQQLGQTVLESLTPAARAKRLDVSASLEPVTIQADGPRIQQVLWNLLANAIKFTPDGGRVEVSVRRAADRVVIRVADTGEGIPAHFLPHVFDRFRQLDSSVTRRHLGMGIGLAIVKDVVDLHGGTVTAESPGEGLGATFTVVLPVDAPVPATPSGPGT